MPAAKKAPNRKRPEGLRIMLAESERDELQAAADQIGVALSVFVRMSALEAARKRRDAA